MNRLLIGLVLLAAPATAQDIAITNARIADGTASEPVMGTVVIRGGRVASVGGGGAPAGVETIDAGGKWVTPGLVSAYSELGLVEVGQVSQTNDTAADDSPYSAALDIAPAINPRSTRIPIQRIEGVTRAAVMPSAGSDLFGGQAAIISLAAGGDPVTRRHAFQFINLGEAGARLAGGSRAATYTRLADAFREAAAFERNPGGYAFGRSEDSLLTRADAEALVDVIEGRTPAMIAVDGANDIERALDLRRDYPRLKMVLVGAAEGWLVADRLARENVPVIVAPMDNLPDRFETLAATQSNAGRMIAAGVKVAVADKGEPRLMPQQAGQLVAQSRIPGATGLTHGQALASITSVPAEILGLDDVGTLRAGAHGDVVIWDGDPIEVSSAPTAVFIDGVRQPMDSRQTRLRDRYNPTNPASHLPPAYTRTR